jgi:hypothetical protein
MFEYWAIQASGESEPTGLFRVVHDGSVTPEYLNIQGEWMRDAALEAFLNGEPGAKPVSKDEARELIEKWGIKTTSLT